MKKLILTLLIITVIASCGQKKPEISYISPYDAIHMAASAAEDKTKVEGIFSLSIQAVGNQGPNWYLNSELDYRDQRNLTISIAPQVVKELVNKHDKDMESIFKGKTIQVEGEAKRVKIAIYDEKRKKLKPYYYQTHVRVTNIHKIEFK